MLYPLLYDNTPVDSIYFPFGSSLEIEIGLDGEIASVRCARIMQARENKAELLSPQEAWKKLLANQTQIQVEGFFGMLPGNHFVVDQSRVTEVRLVYLPEHPALVPTENYDVKYLFKGTARMDAGEIKFKAYVDAVK